MSEMTILSLRDVRQRSGVSFLIFSLAGLGKIRFLIRARVHARRLRERSITPTAGQHHRSASEDGRMRVERVNIPERDVDK
jgi:hypothetical protein